MSRSLFVGLAAYILLLSTVNAARSVDRDFSEAVLRGRATQESFLRSKRRSLLQSTSYSPNSIPPGSKTGNGLLMYTPANCSYLDPDDFGNFFINAYNQNNVRGIYLSAGNYSVFSGNSKPWTLFFTCSGNYGRQAPFEVDLGGSFLSFTNNNEGGFAIDSCFNLYLHGFTATYSNAALPNTQGTITSLQQYGSWSVQIDSGYPTSFLNGNSLVSYAFKAPTGTFVQNTTVIRGAGAFNAVAGSNGAFTFNVPFEVPNVVAGNKLAISAGTPAPPMIYCYICTNVALASINIYSSNYLGINDFRSTNTTYRSIAVTPNPRGINGVPTLLSTNDDAFRSQSPLRGPQFINCNVSSSTGDGISVHGGYYLTASVNTASKSLIIATDGCPDTGCLLLKVQESVRLYAPSLRPLGAATITAISTTSNPGTITGYSQQQTFFNYDQATYFRVTFASVPAAWSSGGPDGLLSSPAENGAGANIVNNTITNAGGRGIYHGGSNGAVSGNVIQQPRDVGILLAPNVFYLQADVVRNLVVQNNFINATYGGLHVTMQNNSGLPAPWNSASNVTLRFNTIIRTQKPLLLTSATGLTVTNNTLRDVSCFPFVNQDQYNSVPASAIIYVAYVSSSTFRQNSASTTGPCPVGNYQSPYYQGPGVTSSTFS